MSGSKDTSLTTVILDFAALFHNHFVDSRVILLLERLPVKKKHHGNK
jgi:hypothetical protein